MAFRLLLVAVLLLTLTACGRDKAREVRLLAPAGLVEDPSGFERATGCRVDLRVYDPGEDLGLIARRRNVDVVAAPAVAPDQSVELARIRLERGLVLTVPKPLARAFDRPARPAGRRSTRWTVRAEGDNDACARRWLTYAAP